MLLPYSSCPALLLQDASLHGEQTSDETNHGNIIIDVYNIIYPDGYDFIGERCETLYTNNAEMVIMLSSQYGNHAGEHLPTIKVNTVNVVVAITCAWPTTTTN